MSGKSRIEKILENLLGENNVIEPPIGRDEKILYSILNDLEYTDPPHSIFEDLLLAIKNGSSTETEYAYEYLTRDEKILFCKLNRIEYFEPPHSRLERLLIKWLYLDLYLNIDGVPPFTFVSNGSPIVDYIISGNEEHSGTPTPDSPIMPQGTGERTGNLAYGRIENTNIGSNGTMVRTTGYNVAIARVEVGKVYTANSYVLAFYTDEPTIGSVSYNSSRIVTIVGQPTTVTAPITGYVAFRLNIGEQAMLNTGSTALPYEPYGYKIPISSANTTTPVYLGEVETTRRIKKLVLTGKEGWVRTANKKCYYINLAEGCPADYLKSNIVTVMCSHYEGQKNTSSGSNEVNESCICFFTGGGFELYIGERTITSAADFKSYLAQQYANGTPVTVWYVLATETTGIVNEPLMKIGDYADTVSKEQAGVSIPTVSGRNTFDVLGDVKPSNVEITYAPRAPLLRTRKTVLKK